MYTHTGRAAPRSSTDLLYRSLLQIFSTDLLFRSSLQISSSDLLYKSPLRIFSTDLLYRSSLQISSTDLLYRSLHLILWGLSSWTNFITYSFWFRSAQLWGTCVYLCRVNWVVCGLRGGKRGGETEQKGSRVWAGSTSSSMNRLHLFFGVFFCLLFDKLNVRGIPKALPVSSSPYRQTSQVWNCFPHVRFYAASALPSSVLRFDDSVKHLQSNTLGTLCSATQWGVLIQERWGFTHQEGVNSTWASKNPVTSAVATFQPSIRARISPSLFWFLTIFTRPG